MNTRLLHLAIIASGCMVALPAYAAPAVMHPITRPEVLQHDYRLIWERRKGDERHGPDVMSSSHGKSSPSPAFLSNDTDGVQDSTPAAAPEIDAAMAGGALTLLAGGMALLGGRRRKNA